ncbi:MAG: hypothetical protein KDC05_06375 [Bacteroidales bacterium]|nr:hypothetical protein [Bacteroidales bacterium]
MKQILLYCLLLPLILTAQTNVNNSSVEGSWTSNGSPYLVQTDIVIHPNDTLIIHAGVEVVFQDFYGLQVMGHLIVNGLPGDSVKFTVADTTGYFNNSHTGWFGIWDMDSYSKSAEISYAIVEYSKLDGLFFQGFNYLNVQYSEFRFNRFNGIFTDWGNLSMEHVTSRNNGAAGIGIANAGYFTTDISNFQTLNNATYGLYLGQGSNASVKNGLIKNNFQGGLYISYESFPKPITNIVLLANGNPGSIGGGIIASDFCELHNCIVRNNLGSNGGGIRAANSYNGSVKILNSTIANNAATNSGGGIYHIGNGGLILINSTIQNNQAQKGGGIYSDLSNYNGAIQSGFYNLLIKNNQASTFGGGMYLYDVTSSSTMSNLTIVENEATQSGSAVYCLESQMYVPLTLTNSIVYNNVNDQIWDASGLFNITYSDVMNGFPGNGNIDSDPLFINDGFYPEDLSETSPCRNAGDPFFISEIEVDIAGRPRIDNDTIDMGAIESNKFNGPSNQLSGTVLLAGGAEGALMNPVLNQNNLIPLSQPFSDDPWNYNGIESLDNLPEDVVDWLLLEYRNAPNAEEAVDSTVIFRFPVLLKSDGSLVDTSGFRKPVFTGSFTDSLYLVIQHRNHLAIMSAFSILNDSGITDYNFILEPEKVYGGKKSLVELPGGFWGMIPANGNADQQIDNEDKNETWLTQIGQTGYLQADYNLDGMVDMDDYETIWKQNSGKGSNLPVYTPPGNWVCGDALTDSRDGQSYSTVMIGFQCWMAENLNHGNLIPLGEDQSDNDIIEKYCLDNLEANCEIFGASYQWSEIMNYTETEGIQGICPEGWHIPSDSEWCVLENYIDSDTVICDAYGYRGIDAGGKFKAISDLWMQPNNGASNQFGFSAIPGGYYDFNTGQLEGTGMYAQFFTSTPTWLPGQTITRSLSYNLTSVRRKKQSGEYGQNLRCIKN